MSTVRVSAFPAEYRPDGSYQIKISLMIAPPYSKDIEASKISEIEAAVNEARAALAGGPDMMISVLVKKGRKPNGFDKWQHENRRGLFQVRKEAQAA